MPALPEDFDEVPHLAGRRLDPRGRRPGAMRTAGIAGIVGAAGGVKR